MSYAEPQPKINEVNFIIYNTMLGAIIGDIVGSTREWHNIKTEDFELVPKGSRFTDDTVMTLAVAEWLMTDPEHRPETLVACMQRLGRKYPHAGYGKMFSQWLMSDHPQPYNSFGNGSAMRVSPVGLYANSLEEALELARITASVSHNHPEGIKGAQAIAGCVFLHKNISLCAEEEIRHFVTEKIGYNLNFKLDDIRDAYGFDVTCQGSVPVAIKAYLERGGYPAEKALRLAISMGGDSDTIGAMTASIAGAKRFSVMSGGFRDDLVNQCRALLPADLLDINDRFEAFVSRPLRTRDRVRGSLMAGAAGDALGYTVEFMSRKSILAQYGNMGITKFDLASDGKALVSDDTQMTLFTACGMLTGVTRGYMRGIGGQPEKYVNGAYLDWYYTQTGKKREMLTNDFHFTWLRDLPELAHRRAPGNTCLSACESLLQGKMVQNNSKGCGGIMRVAPMALLMAGYWSRGKSPYSVQQMDEAGAEVAAVTHKHPLAFLPSAMLTHLIYRVIRMGEMEVKTNISGIALETIDALDNIYKGKYEEEKRYLANLTRMAVKLAANDKIDAENIRLLGEGWTGEEAWAIALYCTVRHVDNMEEAIIAAVNHDGDSDSTGAVCGNIMGAIYGYEAMKRKILFCPRGKELEQTLELSNLILTLADDLYTSCIISEYDPIDTPEKRQWYDRYCEMKPTGINNKLMYSREICKPKTPNSKKDL